MKAIVTCLAFDGNCREAAEFYQRCLGAELYLLPFPEAADDLRAKAGNAKGRIMRATLMRGSSMLLMAADTMPGTSIHPGDNFSVTIHCESLRETERLFATLGEKGAVTMPLQTTCWGARVGALKDQFGIRWSFNFVQSE